MIQDGTQGTPHGDGLVQTLNQYGNAYAAARGYNSGAVAKSGDLSDALGATTCYASDVANRLTGWVKAQTKCSEYGDAPVSSDGGASAAPAETTEQGAAGQQDATAQQDTTTQPDTTAQQTGSGTKTTGDGSYQPDSNGWRRRRSRRASRTP